VQVPATALLALTVSRVAQAQGTMDFSGAQTLMGTLKNTDRILTCRNDSGIEDRLIGMRSFDQI